MEKKIANKMAARIGDYHRTFNTEPGKKVLYDLIKAHCMMSTTFVKGDPQESAMREGERQVVIRILSKLSINIKEFHKLIEEANLDAREYSES